MSAPRLWIEAVIAALRHGGFGDCRSKSSNIYLARREEILFLARRPGGCARNFQPARRQPRNDLGRFDMLRDEQIRTGGGK